jgi:hypothetical protein
MEKAEEKNVYRRAGGHTLKGKSQEYLFFHF